MIQGNEMGRYMHLMDPLYIEIYKRLVYDIYYSDLYLSNDEIHLTLPNTTIKLILQYFLVL